MSPHKTALEGKPGERLMPNVVDEVARTEPDREIFSVPVSSDMRDGWKPITFKQFADAVNRVAGRILEREKPQPGKFPTLAYIGPNDVRYPIMMVACEKAGCQALFISPRNSREGQINLFNKTDCNTIYYDKSYEEEVQPWIKERGMHGILVPTVDVWLKPGPDEGPDGPTPVPYTKTFAEARWDPGVVLHTSGSTGLPKPIVVRMGLMATVELIFERDNFHGYQSLWKATASYKRGFNPMPLFHAAGCFGTAFSSIYFGRPTALGLPDKPLTADSVIEALKYAEVDTAILPPAILEDLCYMPEGIEALKKMNRVVFGGGNLAREAGNIIVRNGIPLTSVIGATETGALPYYLQEVPELWQWFIIDSEAMGCDWRPVAGESDDVYEQVIVRKNKDPGLQGIFYTFPELNEYSTNDLYRKHPTLPHHWIYHGRADNIIVFSTGEKLNPVTIEEIVTSHPRVRSAIVVGTQRFQAGLLLEPIHYPKDDKEAQELIDDVWPTVEEANKETVTHGRIGRAFIGLTDQAKPFPRAGKGTVQRAGAIKLYEKEIDALYERASSGEGEAAEMDVGSVEGLTKSIQHLFHDTLRSKPLAEDTDFFRVGIDSMQVISAVRILRKGLEATGAQIPAGDLANRTVYSNPTPRQLATYLMGRIGKNGAANGGNKNGDKANGGNAEDENTIRTMKAQLDKYTRDLPRDPGQNKPPPSNQGQTVLLTGTTGALGSYLLDFMQSCPAVRKVICLNRGDDGGASRQPAASASRGLSSKFPKAEFLGVDLSKENWGLPQTVYNRLLREADRVIHNAWPVNFNMSIETFEPHVRGVPRLVDFSARAPRRVPIVFVSTVGTTDRWAGPGPVPEKKLEDLSLPSTGYGQGKLVSSLILDEARAVSGVPAAVVRVGQVAGPMSEKGLWNRQEWLPSIVASSLYLGALPVDLGTVDWTPIEGIAHLILEVAGVTSAPRDPQDISGYFHGVNPKTTDWRPLAEAVRDFYGPDRIKRLVPMKEWVRLLADSAPGTKDVSKNPGIKLLDFYGSMAAETRKPLGFDMSRTVRYSKSMAGMKAVTPELMRNWCKQWAY